MKRRVLILLVTLFFSGLGFAALTPLRYVPFYQRIGFARAVDADDGTCRVLEKRFRWFPGPDIVVVPTGEHIPDERIGFSIVEIGFGSSTTMLFGAQRDGRPRTKEDLWFESVHVSGWWVFD